MDTAAIRRRWEAAYGSEHSPPDLTLSHSDRGRRVRVHSLPDGKRYPTTHAEMSAVEARHRACAEVALGKGAICDLLLFHWSDRDETSPEPPVPDEILMAGVDAAFAWSVHEDTDDDGEECWLHIWAATRAWDDDFDLLTRMTAMDQLRLLYVSPQTGRIYQPYDGGVDILAVDLTDAADLRATFSGALGGERHAEP